MNDNDNSFRKYEQETMKNVIVEYVVRWSYLLVNRLRSKVFTIRMGFRIKNKKGTIDSHSEERKANLYSLQWNSDYNMDDRELNASDR